MPGTTMPPEVWAAYLDVGNAHVRSMFLQPGQAAAGAPPAFGAALDAVCRQGGAALAVEELLRMMMRHIYANAVPDFVTSVDGSQELEGGPLLRALAAALGRLRDQIHACRPLLAAAIQHAGQTAPSMAPRERARLLALPLRLQHAAGADIVETPGSLLPATLVRCFDWALETMVAGGADSAAAAAAVRGVAAALRSFDVGHLVDQAAATSVSEHVQRRVAGLGSSLENEAVLADALAMASDVPLAFLELVLQPGPAAAPALQAWRARLDALVHSTLGSLRISLMFDIVVDYPDSRPALEDLRHALRHAGLHRALVSRFGRALRERLLHPGAATSDIIQQYVSTIRALQHVDPSGAVLDAISAPIRAYLRYRRDTTRCIVTLLTDDGDDGAASLFANLDAGGEALGAGGGGGADADADFDGPDADARALAEAERWEPDPVEARDTQRTGPGADAISLLVGIYGSKELFVSEYRAMLADRLLAKADYGCDRELRTLELLKVRFGEASLHGAEVMLRDLSESKRVNANVKSVPNSATPLRRRAGLVPVDALSATIVSQLFWPQMAAEEFALPPQVQAMLDTYAHKYHSLKAPRVLQWKPNLGSVSLDLTIGDRQVSFTVSPFHATLLLHFQHRAEWGAAELAAAMRAAPEALRRRAVYWVNQGVLSERRGADGGAVYRRNEQLQGGGGGGGEGEGGMEVEEGGGPDQEAQEMARLEPFIVGMLTNFDALPLDRIHNMLKMFASDPPYDKTLDQLGAHMARLAADDKVVLEGGMYKRRR